MLTVKQLSTLAGVTPRTLHHYDQIGLLKPSRIGVNGYRYYGEDAVLKLQGFGVPIDHWLRGPLREWAEHLLDRAVLRAQGHFAVVPIRRAWAEHLDGRYSNQYPLWVILMFQAWLEHHHDR